MPEYTYSEEFISCIVCKQPIEPETDFYTDSGDNDGNIICIPCFRKFKLIDS